MPSTVEQSVYRFLRQMNMRISPALLNDKLAAHPDYPSLACITDVLDEMGIDNAAVLVDKEKLQDVPCPFMAYDMRTKEFVLIDNVKEQITDKPTFEKYWDGTALFAEKPDNWYHAANEAARSTKKKEQQKIMAFLFLIAGLASMALLNGFSWNSAGLLFVSMTGIAITTLIVQHELGISNEFAEQLCGTGKDSGCDAVLYSKGSQFGKWFNWADAGIVYFTAYTLFLVSAVFSDIYQGMAILAVLSAAAIPFTFFSLYYQRRVVKKWCPLCLLTVGVLWAQFILIFPVTRNLSKIVILNSSFFTTIFFAAFVFAMVSFAWFFLLKPGLEKNKQLLTEKFALLRFKNNPGIFEGLLQQQRQADTMPFEHDLQVGNPAAPVQIVVACNPYCGPCASTHEALHQLAEKNDIGLTIRFTVKTGEQADKKTETVAYLLQVLQDKPSTYKKQVLYDWYAWMDMKKFKESYPIEKITDAAALLQQQEQWSEQAEIKATPTIFINGYELPKQYRANDLGGLLGHLITGAVKETDQLTENKYVPAYPV